MGVRITGVFINVSIDDNFDEQMKENSDNLPITRKQRVMKATIIDGPEYISYLQSANAEIYNVVAARLCYSRRVYYCERCV